IPGQGANRKEMQSISTHSSERSDDKIDSNGLFADYLKALEPDSIVDVVSREVLQVLLRGFFYADRVGMALLYRDKNNPVQGDEGWLQMEPTQGSQREIVNYWNPACREFRNYPHCDAECRKCDRWNATRIFNGEPGQVDQYNCHLGLWDFGYALQVAGKPSGVLFGGQMAAGNGNDQLPGFPVSSRTQERLDELFSQRTLETAAAHAKQVMEESVPEEREKRKRQYADILMACTDPWSAKATIKAEIRAREKRREDLLRFKEGLEAFCQAFQQTINELYKAKLQEATQAAIVRVNEKLSERITTDPNGWVTPANLVLRELEQVINGQPVFFLVRRRAHYRVMAASPGCNARLLERPTVDDVATPQLGVAYCLDLPERRWEMIPSTNGKHAAWRDQIPWIPRQTLYAYRIDEGHAGVAPLSVILVVAGDRPADVPEQTREQQMTLVRACAESIAYHAHMSSLLQNQQEQQEEFARHVSFAGHHLKTPLQNAFVTLRDIARLGDMDPKFHEERRLLCEEVRRQLEEAQADALMLQATTKAKAERVDVQELLNSLIQQFGARAREHNNPITITSQATNCTVNAVVFHLRAAFTNVLDNAIKYSFANREINVVLRQLSPRHLEIAIVNTGVALKPKKEPQIFNFSQRAVQEDKKRQRPGQGIGLSQSIRLVEQCGGTLRFESRVVSKT
ncbi:MAG: PocR ligand-binding domain-containing protein, partial [Verrucomicrobia bacterium]|nr:PocR ligand-binding domain-containing protein [Verrucomicrobiota bacterium]